MAIKYQVVCILIPTPDGSDAGTLRHDALTEIAPLLTAASMPSSGTAPRTGAKWNAEGPGDPPPSPGIPTP